MVFALHEFYFGKHVVSGRSIAPSSPSVGRRISPVSHTQHNLPSFHSHSAFLSSLMASEPPSKRARLDNGGHADPSLVRVQRAAWLSSISRDISPPPSTRATPDVDVLSTLETQAPTQAAQRSHRSRQHDGTTEDVHQPQIQDDPHSTKTNSTSRGMFHKSVVVPSPITLTRIHDLPSYSNIDTVNLHDILGNPLIKEAWVFNFCFDIDWMMQFFDADIRDLVQVKVVHGSWRNEDSNKLAIDDACRRWKNVEAFKAYLPDQFGTHHSKMFVLFTHDEQAEVVIHTANMLQKDWTNMTQAVWRSGPLQRTTENDGEPGPIGDGTRFRYDLLAYLKEYKRTTQALCKQLQEYDFRQVRGALVASVPSKLNSSLSNSTKEQHLWGYPQFWEVLSHISRIRSSSHCTDDRSRSHLVAQVSSIATLPNGWLQNLVASNNHLLVHTKKAYIKQSPPTLSVVYPTAPNVASSLDGYAAGASIHTKAQSATHLAQINNLGPHLSQWTRGPVEGFQAGREKAAPHIKTYIQYNQKPTIEALERGDVDIDWALLTSANLSVQAWGSLPKKAGGKTAGNVAEEAIVHIQSFEIGVLVWPELFADEVLKDAVKTGSGKNEVNRGMKVKSRMIPVFGKNTPDLDTLRNEAIRNQNFDEEPEDDHVVTIGLRMPYDLPLTPYAPGDMPWSPQGTYTTPDSKGGVWRGY